MNQLVIKCVCTGEILIKSISKQYTTTSSVEKSTQSDKASSGRCINSGSTVFYAIKENKHLEKIKILN